MTERIAISSVFDVINYESNSSIDNETLELKNEYLLVWLKFVRERVEEKGSNSSFLVRIIMETSTETSQLPRNKQ